MFDLRVVRVIITLIIFIIISPTNKHNDASPHDVKTSSLFFHQSPTLPRETVLPLFLSRRASVVYGAFLFRRQLPPLAQLTLRRVSRSWHFLGDSEFCDLDLGSDEFVWSCFRVYWRLIDLVITDQIQLSYKDRAGS